TKLGVSSSAAAGEISDAVKFGFYVGATLLLVAVCWSALNTHEYPPEARERFDTASPEPVARESPLDMRRHSIVWLTLGCIGLLVAWWARARLALLVLV